MLLAASGRLAWPSLCDTAFRCAAPSMCADDMASIERAMLRWHTPDAEPKLQTHAVAEVDDGERVVLRGERVVRVWCCRLLLHTYLSSRIDWARTRAGAAL